MSTTPSGIGILTSDPDELKIAQKALFRAETLFKAILNAGDGNLEEHDIMALADTGIDLVNNGHEAICRFADRHRESWSKDGKGGAK